MYIATSLDGYIDDDNGKVSWLSGERSDPDSQGSYNDFVQTVDTVILGYATHHRIVTELSPDAWVYEDKMSYVIAHKHLENKKNIVLWDDLPGLIERQKRRRKRYLDLRRSRHRKSAYRIGVN